LRTAFPGATVSIEAAETQAKPEQSQNLMGMNGNQAMNHNTPDLSFRGNSNSMDYTPLFESIGVLMGIPSIIPATILVEKEDQSGHKGFVLSTKATQALTEIFEESCDVSVKGMGQREIEEYLHRCGNEQVPPQRIVDIISKYNPISSGGNGGSKARNYINLIGFLGYYRDTVQRGQRDEIKVSYNYVLH
jgi:hypothetical protein